ncbi:DUF4113 domain-containing protein [Legionella sp. 27fs60]|uniref:DUF4113 domain-containing protein n=1 Tax=Legionella bononiensis TaxID=2793102 RepID=A0ABS1WDW9_9GAMM|nr:DUF4113 domain-containing protein [Legionella bononiensis]MBL7527541.1 DUF4113 domain-containing protein [Legionella bononiensis]
MVCQEDFILKELGQLYIVYQVFDEVLAKTEQIMSVFDTINQKYGRHTICLAVEGYSKPWSMRAELKSPAYTTRWSDIARVSL